MELTQQQLESAGYRLPAAPRDTWRAYTERSPVPMYFDFHWLSARHPDLYHAFALSTVGLMAELDRLVDLTGLNVIDVGAGTGRSAMGAARSARTVTAVDIFPGVIAYGKDRLREAANAVEVAHPVRSIQLGGHHG